MPRLELALPMLAVLAVACADDSTAVTTADTTTSTATDAGTDSNTPSPTTTAPDPTASTITTATATDGTTTTPGTASDTATVTSDPTVSTDPTATGPGTTEPGTTATTDTSDTTTGSGVCGVAGETVAAELVHVGKPAACGPLEFTGTRISDQKGPAWQLDGCACGDNCLVPDPWTLNVQAPGPWLPLLPACPRIVVDRAEGFGGCQFVAISVWDLAAPGEPAVYHAGHGLTPTQAGSAELTITPQSIDTCDCEGCCQPAELWDLQFSLAGADVTLSEGESAALGQRNAINFESHHSGLCDAPLDAHWAIRKPA
ncbi:hypothetical protein [Nannocystis radixulma]|uniref:Uncharacterized protein n=1 Tax=Nannocystis radixulma TaxID=2995305 RepID=A0ABT5BQL4_9BACT|nr:hypothetical protein [Nannocystis radixulma]MDC0675216.1 hypothetical protein [Nannocystis radixulma]